MIRLDRGLEPSQLAGIRIEELKRVSLIAAKGTTTSKEIGQRYAVVKDDLWKRQFYKCCFCESKIVNKYNDVEHYRPKAEADRSPGHADRSGYWWLAWSWHNLMFSCALCNRSHKSSFFPLQAGSVPLALHEPPPGQEMPLLIDPFVEDPIDHIQFRPVLVNGRERWTPLPRAGSEKGWWTIKVAGLDNPSLLDLYGAHVKDLVMPRIEDIQAALLGPDPLKIAEIWRREAKRLLAIGSPFVSLTYDVLDHYIPEPIRLQHDLELKKPSP